MYKISLLTLFLSLQAFALSQDTVLLNEIVLNTAAELNELAKLLEVSQKQTEQFEKWARDIDEKKYLIERIEMWASDLVELSQNSPQDLQSLNDSIRRLKSLRKDAQEMKIFYAKEEAKAEHDEEKIDHQVNKQDQLIKEYKNKAFRASKGGADSLQLINQNTATSVYELSKSNKLLLEQNKKLTKLVNILAKDRKRYEDEKAKQEKFYGVDSKREVKKWIASLKNFY